MNTLLRRLHPRSIDPARTLRCGRPAADARRNRQMRFVITVAMLAFVTGPAMPIAAQQLTTGTITGSVQDDQGLRMPGVTVEITNQQTNDVRTTVSNEVGLFTMPALPLGQYSL